MRNVCWVEGNVSPHRLNSWALAWRARTRSKGVTTLMCAVMLEHTKHLSAPVAPSVTQAGSPRARLFISQDQTVTTFITKLKTNITKRDENRRYAARSTRFIVGPYFSLTLPSGLRVVQIFHRICYVCTSYTLHKFAINLCYKLSESMQINHSSIRAYNSLKMQLKHSYKQKLVWKIMSCYVDSFEVPCNFIQIKCSNLQPFSTKCSFKLFTCWLKLIFVLI